MYDRQLNLEIEQGATFQMMLIIKATDTPVDLTGYKARMQIRAWKDDRPGAVMAELSTENGCINIDPLAAKVMVRLAPSVSKSFNVQSAVYDLFVYNTDLDDSIRAAFGEVTVLPAVTRVA